MKLALIEWEDSSSCLAGWHRLGEDDSIMQCITVGLLCREDKKQVVLALSRNECGLFADTIAIPKSSVKRIRLLRVGQYGNEEE